MMKFLSRFKERLARQQNCKGFTLVELMIGTAVSAIVIAGSIGVYILFGRTASVQRQISTMMENQRGAFSFMELNVRMTGFDGSEGTGTFGFTSLPGGWSMSSDRNSDGAIDLSTVSADASEQITFTLYDDGADGVMDLGVEATGTPATRVLVAEGIQALGIAYGVDRDNDGNIDANPVNGNTIWAADSDGDDILDVSLDTDGDGDVDTDDTEGGIALVPTAAMGDIRMVRIWILAQTVEPASKCVYQTTPNVYVVGDTWFTDPNDCFRRRVAVQTFICRNMGT